MRLHFVLLPGGYEEIYFCVVEADSAKEAKTKAYLKFLLIGDRYENEAEELSENEAKELDGWGWRLGKKEIVLRRSATVAIGETSRDDMKHFDSEIVFDENGISGLGYVSC